MDIGTPYEEFLEQAYDRLYMTRGEIYAPQRRPLNFPGRSSFKHIFFLRDPRDVLVSAYYSFGYSHAVPQGSTQRREFFKSRQDIQGKDIDQYAQEAGANWLLPLYSRYRQLLETSESHLYLKYDHFKDDTMSFIETVADYLDIRLPGPRVGALAAEASPAQTAGQPNTHKRSGESQQYLEELRPETVAALNEMFSEVLSYWNFNTS